MRDMALRVQATRRTGWYFRVLEAGAITAGDAIFLVQRPHPEWPLIRLLGMLYERTLNPAELTAALTLPLVPGWRKLFERRLAGGGIEDWSARLGGPAPTAG